MQLSFFIVDELKLRFNPETLIILKVDDQHGESFKNMIISNFGRNENGYFG
jgi:hypothetical protein